MRARRLHDWRSPLTLAVLLLLPTSSVPGTDAPSGGPERIVVVAHRGAHQNAPENTIAALEVAIELGCDYVELDVRRTRDGALVLMHDSTVDRTTNGNGIVQDLTLAELRRLEIDPVGGSARQQVPTFEEALAACRDRIKVYVDHKAAAPAEIIEALRKHEMIADAVVYSSVEQLREFKKLEPNLRIMPPHPGSPEEIAALVKDLRPETLDGSLKSWTAEQVEAAHASGAEVWVDALGKSDNEEGYRRALEIGVDAIQTDRPAEVLEFLNEHQRR